MPSSSIIRRAAFAFIACFVLGVVLFWQLPNGAQFRSAMCTIGPDGSVDCTTGGTDGGQAAATQCRCPDGTTRNIDEANVNDGNLNLQGQAQPPAIPNCPAGYCESKPCDIENPDNETCRSCAPNQRCGFSEAPVCWHCINQIKCKDANVDCRGDASYRCNPEGTIDEGTDGYLTCCCSKTLYCCSGSDAPSDTCEEDWKAQCDATYGVCGTNCTNAYRTCTDKPNCGAGSACEIACRNARDSCEAKCTQDKADCYAEANDRCTTNSCYAINARDGQTCANGKPGSLSEASCKINCKDTGTTGGTGPVPPGTNSGPSAPPGTNGQTAGNNGGIGTFSGTNGTTGGTPGGTAGGNNAGTNAGTNGGTISGTNGGIGTTGTIGGTNGNTGPAPAAPPAPAPAPAAAAPAPAAAAPAPGSSASSSRPSSGASSSRTSSSGGGTNSSTGGNNGCNLCSFCQQLGNCTEQICHAIDPNCIFQAPNICLPCGSSSSRGGSGSSTSRSSSQSSTIVIGGCGRCLECGQNGVPCDQQQCSLLGFCVFNEGDNSCTPFSPLCRSSSSSLRPGSSSSRASSAGFSASSQGSGASNSSVSSARSSVASSSSSSLRNGCMATECLAGGGMYCARTNRRCVPNYDNLPSCFDCEDRPSSTSSSAFGFSSFGYSSFPANGSIGGIGTNGINGINGPPTGGTVGGVDNFSSSSFAFGQSSSFMRSPFCGNGLMNPGEECDDGARNSDTLPDRCRTDCRYARCGDRVVDSAEQCDDGLLNGTPASVCDVMCRRSSYTAPGDLAQVIDLPLLPGQQTPGSTTIDSSLTDIATSRPPAGQSGPAALAAMAAGAAAGWSWLSRKRKKTLES